MPKRMAPRRAPSPDDKPSWNAETRTLSFRGVIVKRFRQPAENQEAILAEFEAQSWPPYIDNPLYDNPPAKRQDRLHDAIKNLNHRRKNHLIRFYADGTGTGVCWEVIEEE